MILVVSSYNRENTPQWNSFYIGMAWYCWLESHIQHMYELNWSEICYLWNITNLLCWKHHQNQCITLRYYRNVYWFVDCWLSDHTCMFVFHCTVIAFGNDWNTYLMGRLKDNRFIMIQNCKYFINVTCYHLYYAYGTLSAHQYLSNFNAFHT